MCNDCYGVKKDREAALASDGLPVLQGSEKQISWATTLRMSVVSAIDTAIAELEAKRGAVEALGIDWCVAEDVIRTIKTGRLLQTSAKWWIDNRAGSASATKQDFENAVISAVDAKLLETKAAA